MEAIGRLAGGIAHDFSNVLTVINSFATFLLESKDPEDIRDCASTVLDAAGRAARLTAQLLAFSRKQVMELKVLDLGKVVSDLDRILRRLIGEDIVLETVVKPGAAAILADASQVEQILMNLAVNARDAMPNGGRLTIETAAIELTESYSMARGALVPPGEYVMLAVSDTGVGMSDETQARLFEPFFTTKEVGRGTGLGLSTVYGIVKQLEGFIWVYSEPGRGSTFKLYFPRVLAEPTAVPAPRPVSGDVHGTETVLLVEDDEDIRGAAARILTKAGYRLLVAANGEGGLELCRTHPARIDLLITDVIMPGMNGRELAEKASAIVPGLRVLYSSGYTDEVIVRHGVLAAGTSYLAKPFTPEGLLRKVRETLDASMLPTAGAAKRREPHGGPEPGGT
jgi:CheY-like chemotaxis protein